MKNISEIDNFISKFPAEAQKILSGIRKKLSAIDPKTSECISYGVPAVELNGKKVLYSAFKNHIGIYPTPAVIKHFKAKLSNFETSEGTIKFPLNKKIPYYLIVEIARYRYSLDK